jgi:3-hydroxyisobutyrate dehydrogenase-like beta-hydroxyacid dehydrogenase
MPADDSQVSDDEVLKSVVEEVVKNGRIKDKIFVDTTTVHPSTTSSITLQLSNSGASYIAGPVFGATPLAIAGQLLMAIAGPPSAISVISPFLEGVIARQVIQVGYEPSQALLLKTTSNFITAGLMMLLSEAHTLAEKTGLPTSVLEQLVENNFGQYAHGVSKRLTSGVYFPPVGTAPSSGLELGIKDVGHGFNLAKEKGMKLGIGEMYLDAAREAKEYGDKGGRKCDSTAVYGVVRQRAGLEFESGVVKDRDAKEGK